MQFQLPTVNLARGNAMTITPDIGTTILIGCWTIWEGFRCRYLLGTKHVQERIATGVVLILLCIVFSIIIQKSSGNHEQYRQDQQLALSVTGLMSLDAFEARLIQRINLKFPQDNEDENRDLSIRLLAATTYSDYKKLAIFFRSQLAHKNAKERNQLIERYQFEKYEHLQQSGKAEFERAWALNQRSNAIDTLHSMSERNDKFHASLTAGVRHASQASRTLILFRWGLTFLCLLYLTSMYICRRLTPEAPPWVFPMYIALCLLGLCLVSDFSLNYLWKNRYLVYYMYIHIITAALFYLLVMIAVRSRIMQRFIDAMLFYPVRARVTAVLIFIFTAALCISYRKLPWFTSEVFKLNLVICLAWIAAFRSDYLTRRIEINGFFRSLLDWKWQWENLKGFLLSVFLFSMGVIFCKDFGPLLIMIAVISIWVYLVMGGASFCLITLIWGIGSLLFSMYRNSLPHIWPAAGHINERFNELISPFHFGSGDLGKLIWWRKSSGLSGYPLAELPWFGFFHDRASQLVVVPKEIPSDYTASHIVAQFGYFVGGLFLAIFLIYLWSLHQKSARSLATASTPAERFFGWFLVVGTATLLVQAILTIAGNGCLFALSGVTLPLVSYGKYSLLFGTLIVATLHATCFKEAPHE